MQTFSAKSSVSLACSAAFIVFDPQKMRVLP